MHEILFTDKARKQFLKLEKPVQERIVNALDRIRIRPEAFITKLVGDVGYKFRIGDYRALLDIDQGRLLILVLKIGHRKNIYD
ncbi:MAG: type II toxin-antitoxin system RelE/ParE family toxin [Candidatus Woesearchaeota archaeon]|nr:type II toxin-antitoxin system RelE/ParE family toxin [Candidatus Woesearchaeota archaeon]